MNNPTARPVKNWNHQKTPKVFVVLSKTFAIFFLLVVVGQQREKDKKVYQK